MLEDLLRWQSGRLFLNAVSVGEDYRRLINVQTRLRHLELLMNVNEDVEE